VGKSQLLELSRNEWAYWPEKISGRQEMDITREKRRKVEGKIEGMQEKEITEKRAEGEGEQGGQPYHQ